MTRDDAVLLDIVNAARHIQAFVQDMREATTVHELKSLVTERELRLLS